MYKRFLKNFCKYNTWRKGHGFLSPIGVMVMLWYITIPVFGGLALLAAIISSRLEKKLKTNAPKWLFYCQVLSVPFLLAFLHGYVVDQPLLNPFLLAFYMFIASIFLLIPSFMLKIKDIYLSKKVE